MRAKLKICHLTYIMRIGDTEQVIINLFKNQEYEHVILCLMSNLGPFGNTLQEQRIEDRYEAELAKYDNNASFEKTLTIGTIARLAPIKNHELMIRAAVELKKTGLDINLLIIGDEERKEELSQLIEDYDAMEYITMFGFDPEPQKHLFTVDIFY